MCYLMLLYPCSHKAYRPMVPCEKPTKHWTGLWRTKHDCSRRVPSLQDRVCARCHVEQASCSRGDPESELTAALARLPARYVGVEPRPRDFSASPPASPQRRRQRRPSFPSGVAAGTSSGRGMFTLSRGDGRKDKKNNDNNSNEKRIEVIAAHKLSRNTTTTTTGRDLEDAGFGGTSYRQPPVEDQQQHRSFPSYNSYDNKHSTFSSSSSRPWSHQQQTVSRPSSSSQHHHHATRPDSPVPRPVVVTPMMSTALWVDTTGRYVDGQGVYVQYVSPFSAAAEEQASPDSHNNNNRKTRTLTSSHHHYRGATTTAYSSSPAADRSGWDSPAYTTVVGSARSQVWQHLERPRTRPASYRGVTFSSIGRADRFIITLTIVRAFHAAADRALRDK